MLKLTFRRKGVDLFHAKILFYICTGANGFYFDVHAFFLFMGANDLLISKSEQTLLLLAEKAAFISLI